MNWRRIVAVGVAVAACLAWSSPRAVAAPAADVADAAPSPESQLFRVFLDDDSSLTSVSEPMRLDGRVIFWMATSITADGQKSQLIDLAAERVDWPRTEQYTESVHAQRYLVTRAEADYTLLTTEMQRWLDDVALAPNAAARLPLAEQARRILAEWPAGHYGYKRDEIRQMVSLLDEIIADLRASLGYQRFDMSLVATTAAPVPPRLLPPPSMQQTIDETLAAARITTSASDRLTLLDSALDTLNASGLNSEWASSTRTTVSGLITKERNIDRSYKALHEQSMRDAKTLASAADVRGVERVVAQARTADAGLMNARPDVFAATLAALESELDAARQLRLARDRWMLRRPVLRRYRAAIAGALARLQQMVPALDDIKSLAGSPPDAIASLLDATKSVRLTTTTTVAPSELQSVHALIATTAQLAESAATLRREATLTGRMDQAWNASSAAAGALMLVARVQQDLQSALGMPQRKE